MITAILNGYKRPSFLQEQVDAIRNQTIPPTEIMLWQNSTLGFDSNLTNQLTTAASNKNFGVWARFAFALNAKTEYICVFDDDTIPGSMWFENCLNTMKTHEGLLGTVGLIYDNPNSYRPHKRYGWADMNNDKPMRVDIVGHAWFFKREWLTAFWRELPPIDLNMVGEDMHFSYTLQKYLGLNTYVPPHPIHFKEMWGSLKGWEMGVGKEAISNDNSVIDDMNTYHKELVKRGFKLIKHG
jgi:Glycosyl transferase family 2